MSLKIEKVIADSTTITLSGRLDTTTAPDLEAVLDEVLPSATDLIFDLAGLEYISSAGLRVVLKAQKAMKSKGNMKLIHVSENVMEVFDITGFVDFLTFE
ncbi:MAG: STAS domain-containing protein [Clostridia bacterium]|nr:STAS domain-containing protein [Clostridia bacterium]